MLSRCCMARPAHCRGAGGQVGGPRASEQAEGAPHLRRDWGSPLPHLRHICAGTGAHPCRLCATSPPLRHIAASAPHLRRDWAHLYRICARTGLTPAASAPLCPLGAATLRCAGHCCMTRRQRRSAAWSRAATSERCHSLRPLFAGARTRAGARARECAAHGDAHEQDEGARGVDRADPRAAGRVRPQRSVRRLLHGRVAPVAACIVAAYTCRVATYNCRVAARDRRCCQLCR
jgi:hypothetical protein